MADATRIVIERTGSTSYSVRADPSPADGSYCSDTFRDVEKAGHFAWRLHRARGWPIDDHTRRALL